MDPSGWLKKLCEPIAVIVACDRPDLTFLSTRRLPNAVGDRTCNAEEDQQHICLNDAESLNERDKERLASRSANDFYERSIVILQALESGMGPILFTICLAHRAPRQRVRVDPDTTDSDVVTSPPC